MEKPRVVFVDDHRTMRLTLVELVCGIYLKDLTFDTVQLSSTEELLRWLADGNVAHAIVCDNNTGSALTGSRALAQLRDGHIRTPFLLFTFDNLDEDACEELLRLDAAHVNKGSDNAVDLIAEFIRNALRSP